VPTRKRNLLEKERWVERLGSDNIYGEVCEREMGGCEVRIGWKGLAPRAEGVPEDL
jgi:hypothetical protein